LLCAGNSFADAQLDSLLACKTAPMSDSVRANHEVTLGEYYQQSNTDSALFYFRGAIPFYQREIRKHYNPRYIMLLARVYLRIGLTLKNKSELFEARKNYDLALALFEYNGDKLGVAECLNNTALIYYQFGDLANALKYLTRSVQLLIEIGEEKNAAYCYINIASVYEEIGNYDLALENYLSCLAILERLKDDQGLTYVHNNLGYLYHRIHAYTQALEHDFKAYALAEKISDKRSMSYSFANIGVVYYTLGEYDRALGYFEGSLALRKEVDDRQGIVYSYNNLAETYHKKGDLKKALAIADEALKEAKSLGYPELISTLAKTMMILSRDNQDYKKALEAQDLYVSMKDSIQNQQNRELAIRQEMQLNFNLRETEMKKVQEAQKLLHQAESRRQKLIILTISIVVVLAALLAWMMLQRYRQSQKQKKEIEEQKAIVDEKNREILDSILYAKRLQDAILPPLHDVRNLLGEYFLIYKPKDIVAGDFYFLEDSGNKVVFAVADCTGHGVPGAMVSVVCSNALTRVVKEMNETDPGIILDEVSKMVEHTFSKSEEQVMDGMDVSLCVYDRNSNTLQWAGANNPLWILRENRILEIAPDKQPIGKYFARHNFTTHQVPLKPGDILLLFSDGYADQFGGPSGKKMKYVNLKKLLTESSGLSLVELENRLQTHFLSWKGDIEQIDDVCFMGIRLAAKA
jgi:serine phosphatase RsbU (regulator of sigma subunit)